MFHASLGVRAGASSTAQAPSALSPSTAPRPARRTHAVLCTRQCLTEWETVPGHWIGPAHTFTVHQIPGHTGAPPSTLPEIAPCDATRCEGLRLAVCECTAAGQAPLRTSSGLIVLNVVCAAAGRAHAAVRAALRREQGRRVRLVIDLYERKTALS